MKPVLLIGAWVMLTASAGPQGGVPYSAKAVELELQVDEASIKGNKNAKVILIEFADYQCPLCRSFAADTMNQIEKNYIDTGRVRFAVRHTPIEEIHPEAFKAAEAAHCGRVQGRFWELHERLIHEPMALAPKDLLTHARTLGLDMPKFTQCLTDDKTAAAIRQEMREAEGLGIRGTPIFLVGVKQPGDAGIKALRMIKGAHPYGVFKAALDEFLNTQK